MGDAAALDDAAVSDLLESIPTYPSITFCETKGERRGFGTGSSVLVPILMALTLIIGTTIAFVIVASRAPHIAGILFLIFVVLTPMAVASAIRERASPNQAPNTPASETPERPEN